MRKQTKIVAVASAAALLAIGASMTAFAAQGWVEEDGTWYYYDNDGNRVEDEWKRSGDSWYWLDSEEGGAMAVDKLIEDDDDTYYVDSNGVMVRNTWIKIVNEDQDDEDDPAEYHYYYMQSNGKAYKAPDSGATRFKTIDGKRYAFDGDGVMLYGWVNKVGERLTDDYDWATTGDNGGVYYLGNWDDGAMKTGWQRIYVYDELEDDDMEYWFRFNANGQKVCRKAGIDTNEITEKTINGKKYGFDERGVMVYEWTVVASSSDRGLASASKWKYFNSIEDGARVSKGWFKVVAPDVDNDNDNSFLHYNGTFASTDANDETERWYWADGSGNLAEGEIRKIKGKYYGFRPEDDGAGKGAAMLSGLVLLETEGEKITKVVDDGVDSDELTDILQGIYDRWPEATHVYKNGKKTSDIKATLFYFGASDDEDTDGVMKTGNVSLSIDGDSYQFQFSKTGGADGKGRGITGIDDGKYIYNKGCRIKADSDEKYVVAWTTGDVASGGAQAMKVLSSDLREDTLELGVNKDGDTVKIAIDQWAEEGAENGLGTAWDKDYYLVNTSGAVVKSKTAAKDGDDWYFYVDDKNIKMYINNKVLRKDDKIDSTFPEEALDDWDDWKTAAEKAEEEDTAEEN